MTEPVCLYVCPTALEVESLGHGGFDTCCGRPELHVPLPDGPATDALSEALSEARKREYALTQELARATALTGAQQQVIERMAREALASATPEQGRRPRRQPPVPDDAYEVDR